MAKATMQLTYQIGSGGTVTVCNTGADTGPVICPSIVGSGVTITEFSGISNSPGTSTNTHELASTLDITNSGSSSATVTLWVSAQNFTAPTAPPDILWSNEQSLDGVTGTTTGNAIDCVDSTNVLQPGGIGGTSPTYCLAGQSLSNVAQTITGAASANNTTTRTITSLSGPYALSTEITLTLGAGAEMHFQDSQILSQVPEPTSIILMGTLMLGLGLASRFRKTT
jgi:hypothetical protein